MEFDLLPWFVALFPGVVALLAALYSFDAVPALLADVKRSWSDIPTVEALQHLLLHAVFYVPLWIAVVAKLILPPTTLEGLPHYVVTLASAAAVCAFFALGRGCIAKVRQLERLEELAAQRREEERLAAAMQRP